MGTHRTPDDVEAHPLTTARDRRELAAANESGAAGLPTAPAARLAARLGQDWVGVVADTAASRR